MVATAEALSYAGQAVRTSALKKPMTIGRGDMRLVFDGDCAVRGLTSLSEERALFGRNLVYFYKVQAGIVVSAQKPDWLLRHTPSACGFSGKIFGTIEILQSLEFSPPPSAGFIRRVRLRNVGDSPVRIRIIGVSDPTAANIRDPIVAWGSLGVNAFNRQTHVVLDEISEPHPARVVGSSPGPTRLYMTTDRTRVTELLQAGDVGDSTAGMSGQVIILSLHDFVIPPSGGSEVVFESLYSSGRLEEVLSEFGRLGAAHPTSSRGEPLLACSSPRIGDAFTWALASLEGAELEADLLDRTDILRGLLFVRPEAIRRVIERTKGLVCKGGLLPHALDSSKPGVLESSLFVSGVCRVLLFANEKKPARLGYPLVRKMGVALLERSKGGSIQLDPSVPQGWRRRIRSGYPSGEVPEVSLAAAAALLELSGVSRLLGKGEDAARFRETAEMILDGVGKRLVDDRGFLCLSVDPDGRPRTDVTLDIAMSCYRNPALRSIASSGVHRLLEKDFETDYGPRTVPITNRMYFNGSYGEGQLGGYWTRAALAVSCLSYAVGLPGIGGLTLERVSRLVLEDSVKMGGGPGEFPYWVDVDGREVHSERSDPVAAARFVQAVVEGELGFAAGSFTIKPPDLSSVKWALARNVWVGERATVFVGRAGGRATSFGACQKVGLEGGQRFAESEDVEISPRGVSGVTFYGPGQVVCLGNSSQTLLRAQVTVAAKSPGLTKRLSTPLEEFEPKSGTWNKTGSLRVSTAMTFEASIPPGDWKVYRVSDE